MRRSLAVFAGMLVAMLAESHAARAQSPVADERLTRQRIIKLFDFTEPDNHEPVPMYWRKVQGKGFPQHASGVFDFEVGHSSTPSFFLDSNGGNVAYRYFARGIPAQAGSDYQVRAWIKPHRLRTARAYVASYFMDRVGDEIEGTQRVSRPIGGDDTGDSWQEVKFILPGDVPEAQLLAVALYVVQSNVWQQEIPSPRAIFTPDIDGGAWFDEIAVLRLPRVRLECHATGGVFPHDHVPTLVAEVHDFNGEGLAAELVLKDATGLEKWRRELPVCLPGDRPPSPVRFPDLTPGVYTATLHIRVDGVDVRAPQLRFARLGPELARGHGVQRGFGLLVDNESEELWPAVSQLTDMLGIWQVKVSMWAHNRPAGWMSKEKTGQASFLAHMYRKNGMAVGTLGGVPRELRDPNLPYERSLLDLFSEAPANFGGFLKYALARYAPFVEYWQIGADGDRELVWDLRLCKTVSQLSGSFRELISNPLLATPWSVQQTMEGGTLPSAAVSLFVPRQIPAEGLPDHYAPFRELPFRERWLTVENRDPAQYERYFTLCDYTKRLVAARATGADIVFTEQPWSTRRLLGRVVAEPDERFLILRTLVSTLSNSRPMTPLKIGQTIQGYLFDRTGVGVLVLWDERAPPEGTRLTMNLGGSPLRITAWGEVSPVPVEQDRHVMHITRMPVIYENVSRRLVMLRGALRLVPPYIESSLTLHEVALEITNPYRDPISGRVRLDVPERWDVSPIRFEFSLASGETSRQLLAIRFPQVETAGKKPIVAHLMLDAGTEYDLRIPMTLDVGLNDLGVTALAQRIGDNVVVRQRITNFSNEPVNYRSFLIAPGRVRQTRLVSNLQPGQSVVKDYRFENAADLAGKRMRIGLREVDGPLIHNEIIEVP